MYRFALILLLAAPPVLAGGRVFGAADVQASSEPVSIDDMVNGWEGDFQPGTYAYADGRMVSGVEINGWQLSREQRWYYYLKFSRDTSRFYYRLENDLAADDVYDLDLDVRSFHGNGIRLGKAFRLQDWQLTPSFAFYHISEFQIGRLQGVSAAGSEVSASATLDYHFDEDKILEYQADVPQGQGYSLDLMTEYSGFEHWQLQLTLGDVLNYWYLPDAAYTTGCINLGSASASVCSSSGSASGRSGQDDYSTQIPVTFDGHASYVPAQLDVALYIHGRYRRLSLEKDWTTPLGEAGVSLHSTRQLGLHWRSRYHELSLVTDNQQLHDARDLQMRLLLQWPW